MSFSIPKNVPSFSNPNRGVEDHRWASRGVAARRGPSPSRPSDGLLDNVRGFFAGGGARDGLPMYKDKPYSYATSRRERPLWRRRRFVAAVTAVLLLCLFFFFDRRGGSGRDGGSRSWLAAGFGGDDGGDRGRVDWARRRDLVVEAFELSWDAYETYAWGYDEYHPIARTGKRMSPSGLGWVIIDSLDTMMIMNLTSRVARARKWIDESLTWDQDQDVNTFETTIRMLGGLLAAHYLSTSFPELAPLAEDDPGSPGEDLYLEKAKDLADRLMGAFDSPSGIPYASVHLGEMRGIPSHADAGASSTAEAATLQLEFKYLAKLTGEREFWDKAEKVVRVIDDNGALDGLVPIYVHPATGEFRGSNIRLGSRGDSYYEYLIKQFLQTSGEEPVYRDMWGEALAGVRKHLVARTAPSGFTIIGERPEGLAGALSPKMDHLVCFMPGTIALAATGGLAEADARRLPSWTRQKADDMQLARELMHTCWGTYKFMATGLAPEITNFRLANPADPAAAATLPPQAPDFDDDAPDAAWRRDFFVKPADVHNLQRPETVESLFYMWRITGEAKYREWGWEMFRAFMNHTAVPDGGGFTSLAKANVVPPVVKDNMESFWLAETLKYFFLLFSPDDLLPLDRVVFNTEAHPLPRFSTAPLFSTGWKRKPRDASGRVIKESDDSKAGAIGGAGGGAV